MKCFVIAMEKEAAPIIAAMNIESDNIKCGKRVICGTLRGKDTTIIICGVGKVNAASGAQYAIDCLNADTVINLGVAGGLNKTCEVGKLYCVSRAVQYDFDLMQLNGTKIGTLDECKENYLPLATTERYPQRALATGDRFNDSAADFKLLTEELFADIRDMEGGAVAQVCMHAGVPCFEFKIISDIAGSGSTTEQYLKNLAICAQTLEREIDNLVNSLWRK